jgi:hypothetical protein
VWKAAHALLPFELSTLSLSSMASGDASPATSSRSVHAVAMAELASR